MSCGPDRLPPLVGNPLLAEHASAGRVSRRHPLRQSLVRRYAYGVPNDDVLDAIATASPAGVVELGAGTGYWARLLHNRGVDVVAYDRWPPGSGANRFVDDDVMWFPVRAGDERAVTAHSERTLLLVWPTWNETWPADAAAAFHAAGGTTLVFVGEGPGGSTGDRVLHAQLGNDRTCVACSLGVADAACVCGVPVLWRAVQCIAMPQWADVDDACTIYRRVSAREDSDRHRRWLSRLRRAGARRPSAYRS